MKWCLPTKRPGRKSLWAERRSSRSNATINSIESPPTNSASKPESSQRFNSQGHKTGPFFWTYSGFGCGGSAAEVLEPGELREAVRGEAERLVARYEGRVEQERTGGESAPPADVSQAGLGNEPMAERFTEKQGQYLAFIDSYTVMYGKAPSEVDLQRFFGTTPPSIHQMILTLEKKGLISRVPGRARSIRLLVDREEIPRLMPRGGS